MKIFLSTVLTFILYLFSARFLKLFDQVDTMLYWIYFGISLVILQVIILLIFKRYKTLLVYLPSCFMLLITFLWSGLSGYTASHVDGISAKPTIEDGDLIITRWFDLEFNRGTMVFVDINGKRYIKRIHGTPDDIITLCDNKVFVNNYTYNEKNQWKGKRLQSPKSCSWKYKEIQLKENEYFVLGDNMQFSYDSRNFGPVELERISGNHVFSLRDGFINRETLLTANFKK